MRNLVCITNENGKDLFHIVSNRGELVKLTTDEVMNELSGSTCPAHLLVDNICVCTTEGRLSILNEAVLRSGKGTDKKFGPAFTVTVYVEGKGKFAKHVGYKAFNPVTREIEVFSRSAYLGIVKRYGCLNGEVKALGTSTVEIVVGKVKEAPAERNVGVYLKIHHGLRYYLNKKGLDSDKVVRISLKELELRHVAPVSTASYYTPKGVSSVNIKNWKFDDYLRLFVEAKPQVEELVLRDTIRSIGYTSPNAEQHTCPKEILPLLGAFSDWGLKKYTVEGKWLETIGDYAFYGNKLKEIMLGTSVKVLGKGAFQNNQISRLSFERRDGLKVANAIEIGDDCFKDNNITGVLYLPDVSNLGRNALKGNPIDKLVFGRKSTLSVLRSGSLAGLNLEVLFVPDSVVKIEGGALAGTPVKKLVFGKNSQIKCIEPDCVDEIRKVQIIGTGVKPAFKSVY